MLVIRMQRTGRKGHAMFRVVVQESRQTPTSGKVIAAIGSYDPHAKTANLDKDKASFYLKNGAQPSPRVVHLLQVEKVKLPDWVTVPTGRKRTTRNPEKLRKNQPAVPAEPEAKAAEPALEVVETPSAAEAATEPEKSEEPAEQAADQPKE
jgi:small subunit ribosomal protein S16